jgi:hypothetical protein
MFILDILTYCVHNISDFQMYTYSIVCMLVVINGTCLLLSDDWMHHSVFDSLFLTFQVYHNFFLLFHACISDDFSPTRIFIP